MSDPTSVQSVSLNAMVAEHLAAARAASSGRSARSVHGEHSGALRHTLIALAAGSGLAEHDSPGAASLQVLAGRIRFTTASEVWEGTAGDLLIIPDERHAVQAVDDSAFLLTVAVG